MRTLALATCMIILQSFPALAEEASMQPIQLSDAQMAVYGYVPQPVAQPMPVQRAVAPVAPAPDLTQSWDVMQYNFGM